VAASSEPVQLPPLPPVGSPPGSDAALGVVRGISYGLFRPPDPFVAQARALGATLVRVYLYWSQIEPEPDRWTFDVVDHFLGQLDGSETVWITVVCSSPWATRQPASFLPPSPARDPERYRRFVSNLVQHCARQVRYWQCDNEPANVGLTWMGTAEDYLAQLRIIYQAVKQADPSASVVLGGATYGLPPSASDAPERRFFDILLRGGGEVFDLFDLHLYGPPERIGADVEAVRALMRAHGYEKPVVIGEYGGPIPDSFPAAEAAIAQAMATAAAAAGPEDDARATATGSAPASGPDAIMRRAVADLYYRRASLPPELQMFLSECPPELEAKRDRIACREIVTRNVLALAAGVRVTACWKLAPEVGNYADPKSVMELLYGKLLLMDYAGDQIGARRPAAATFAILADQLRGLEAVTRLESAAHPRVVLHEVRRHQRPPLLVAWRTGDAFSGEDEPASSFSWFWPPAHGPAGRLAAVDAFGRACPAEIRDGKLWVGLGITPIFIAPS